MTESIEILGVDDILDKLGIIGGFRYLREPFLKWAYTIQGDLATYPPVIPSGLFMRTATPKQIKKFFAMLSSGEIRGGRTGDTGRGWTSDVSLTNDEIKAVIGNSMQGVKFVQGEHQQPFHAGRWQTVEEVTDKHRRKIIDDIGQAVLNKLRGK